MGSTGPGTEPTGDAWSTGEDRSTTDGTGGGADGSGGGGSETAEGTTGEACGGCLAGPCDALDGFCNDPCDALDLIAKDLGIADEKVGWLHWLCSQNDANTCAQLGEIAGDPSAVDACECAMACPTGPDPVVCPRETVCPAGVCSSLDGTCDEPCDALDVLAADLGVVFDQIVALHEMCEMNDPNTCSRLVYATGNPDDAVSCACAIGCTVKDEAMCDDSRNRCATRP